MLLTTWKSVFFGNKRTGSLLIVPVDKINNKRTVRFILNITSELIQLKLTSASTFISSLDNSISQILTH